MLLNPRSRCALGIRTVLPTRRRNKEKGGPDSVLTDDEALQVMKVANIRIHVELAMRRIKEWKQCCSTVTH
jgi:hypothetical protein